MSMRRFIPLFLWGFLCLRPALAITPTVTGYEIVVDPSLVQAIKPLKPKFLANIGKPFDRKILLEDVRRFQLLGTVGMVRTGQEDWKNGKKLLYKVEANPLIRSLELRGVTQFKQEEILEGFKSKVGQLLDYTRLFNDVNTIPDLYLSRKGIMYADVTDLKDITVHDGHVQIQVREFRLGDVRVEGLTGKAAELVLRTFKLHHDDLIVRDSLLGSLCNIYQLDEVKELDWFPKFDHEKGLVDIILSVTPAKSPTKTRSAD